MRSETFGQVFKGAARLCGLDPARLPVTLAEALAGWIEQRVTQAWEAFPWPELCPVEERFYAPLYDADTTYAEEALVRVMDEAADPASGFIHPCAYYTLLNVPGQAATPGTNEAIWATVAPDRLIDLEQPADWDVEGGTPTPMGEVLSVHRQNPKLVRGACPVGFWLSEDQICLDPHAPSSVFVEFRLRPASYTSTQWDANATYAVGSLVYYGDENYVAGSVALAAYLTVSGTATLAGISPNGRYLRTADVVNGQAVYHNTDNNLAFFSTGAGWVLLQYLAGAPFVIPNYFQNTHAGPNPASAAGAYTGFGAGALGVLTVSTVTQAATNPAADPNWTVVRVPHVLANYARRAAVADFLADDGQTDKAFAQERRAADWLEEQIIAVTITQRQTANYSVKS